MGKRIYVGGLPYSTTDPQLQALFSAHGTVESAQVIVDKFTGRSKGFGFVEMTTDSEAANAIAALNGTELDGRTLNVSEAKPRENKASFGEEGRSGGRGDQRRGGGRGRW
jgi:RNA recognition motif-containing protein